MRKKTVYIETSIVSYPMARPTADLLAAAWQKVTLDWWEMRRGAFKLYTSEGDGAGAGRTPRRGFARFPLYSAVAAGVLVRAPLAAVHLARRVRLDRRRPCRRRSNEVLLRRGGIGR